MDHVPAALRLRSFQLHLATPMNRRSVVPKSLTLIYLSRSNASSLEINGAEISTGERVPFVLRRMGAAETAIDDEFEVAFESTDRVCADDEFGFEVCVDGGRAVEGVFSRRGARWALGCRAVRLAVEAEVRVVTDEGFLMREKVKQRRKRVCRKLPERPWEDEEEKEDEQEQAEEQEMRESSDWNRWERKGKDSKERAKTRGFSWAVNVGIFVACVGVGLFVFRGSLKRFVRTN